MTTSVPFGVALAESLRDPAVRAEWERTAVARELSIWLIRFRNQHHMTQADLAGALGLKQPAVARLEAAEHESSIATLRRLAARLGQRVSLVLEPDCVKLAIDDELTRCSPETPATVEEDSDHRKRHHGRRSAASEAGMACSRRRPRQVK